MAEKFILPSDYTFTPGGLVVHKDTYERLVTLMDQVEKRDPDANSMYIYNDFFGYAILELVDELLASIHTQVLKKKWSEAWRIIETLANFNEMSGSVWTQVDDGERVIATERVYGAFVVATLRGLDAEAQLNEETIPNLDRTLESIAALDIEGVPYSRVVKGFGKKLFGDRTKEEREQRREAQRAAYKEFVQGLSEIERKKRGDLAPGEAAPHDDDDDEDDEDGNEPWFGKAKAADADLKHKSLTVTPRWKDYRDAWAAAPHKPLKGYPSWDISTWPAEWKAKFSFDNPNADFF